MSDRSGDYVAANRRAVEEAKKDLREVTLAELAVAYADVRDRFFNLWLNRLKNRDYV